MEGSISAAPKYFILYKEDNKFISRLSWDENIETKIDIYFKSVVKLRGYGPITIISTIETNPPHEYLTALSKEDLPVYKSNLQKCIRRRLDSKAIRTAYSILSLNEFELLRRLPIIMMEDVLPHPSIRTLVWWMMATSKPLI
jgi:hypothetical protein